MRFGSVWWVGHRRFYRAELPPLIVCAVRPHHSSSVERADTLIIPTIFMSNRNLKFVFGNTVKERRLASGLSQEDLAEAAGLHRTYISDVERGTRNLSMGSIEKLARALDLSVSSLFENAGYGG